MSDIAEQLRDAHQKGVSALNKLTTYAATEIGRHQARIAELEADCMSLARQVEALREQCRQRGEVEVDSISDERIDAALVTWFGPLMPHASIVQQRNGMRAAIRAAINA